MQQGDRDPRSGAANRMAEGDCPTVDVQLRGIEMQFAVAGQDLSGEGLVEFYQVEVGHAKLMLLLHLAQRRYWTNPHNARIHASRGHGHNTGEWLEIVFLGKVF